MIEMVRNAMEASGRDRFSCSDAEWSVLQELGQTFGWQPRGTTYLVPERLRIELPPVRHDYRAGGPLDYKRLDDDDAVAWAHALDTAKQSPQFAALLAQRASIYTSHHEIALQTLNSLVYEFTQFAYGGAFAFAEAASTSGENPQSSA